jgi:membrane fusion protein, multidrug efflux system
MRRERLKTVLPIVVVIAGIIVMAILVQARPPIQKEDPEPQTPLVRVVRLDPVDVRINIPSQGTVEAQHVSEIVAQVSGTVTSVAPDFAAGGRLRRGEMILQLDPRDYHVALAQSEAALAQARTRLARVNAEAEIARREWSELGTGSGTPLALQEPQLAEARAVVEAAEASLMQARLNLARTTIRAPFDGRILHKRVDLGQFVPAGSPIATIYAVEYAEVSLPVTSRDLALIDLRSIGTDSAPRVVLRSELGGAMRQWEGRIVRTAGAIDPGSRMLELIARIDRPFSGEALDGLPLQVGAFVTAEIEGVLVEGVFLLPRGALRRDSTVFVVDDHDRLRMRRVEVLRTTATDAVIRSGITSADRVILSPMETPVEGMTVQVEDNGSPANGFRDSTGGDVRP